jgi:tetratricopeptide (TPR) repeat protein
MATLLTLSCFGLLPGCPFGGARYVSDPDRSKGLPESPADLVGEADRLLSSKLSEMAPPLSATDRAMAALEKALKQGHDRPFEVLWRLSRACFLMTERVQNNYQQRVYAKRGVAHARRARQMNSKRVEPYYFLALNTAKVAQSTSNMNLIKTMVATMQQAARIDSRYDDAGPLRFLGKVHITAPAWPVSVGSAEKAIEVLARAVAIAPIPLNLVFLGEAYFHDEEYEQAEIYLKKALKHPRVNRMPAIWRREAEKYLKRIQTGPATDPRTNL